MRRTISLFIRYKSLANDEIVSRFININISEIPGLIREKYVDKLDLEYIVGWYIYSRYKESRIEIINISVLNELHDFIYNSI